jgi:hypothetical protein
MGGPATTAQTFPAGVAVDGASNLLIADSANNRIRKVATTGIITTVAGTGNSGFSGDGGLAINAQFSDPTAVAIDRAGNLFIVDSGNSVVRMVTTTGIITTVAGNGKQGFSGDSGPAINAQLSNPTAVAVDGAGDLFVADSGNNRIRKVATTGIITTFAGNGAGGFSGDGGPASSAQMNIPQGVAVDGSNNVFIADSANFRVRKVSTNGIIITVAGNGSASFSGDGGPAVSAQLGESSLGWTARETFMFQTTPLGTLTVSPVWRDRSHCRVAWLPRRRVRRRRWARKQCATEQPLWRRD